MKSEYIGYVHSSYRPYGNQKEIVYYIISKRNKMYEVERHSEYTGNRSSRWYTLKELKIKIRGFDHITEKGKKYLKIKSKR